jgi:KRAB domain-containing zinc finger protein
MKDEPKSESTDEDNAENDEDKNKKKPSISTTTACIYCKSIFGSQKKYIEHVAKDHRGKKPFKCKICSVGVVRLTSLREHMNKHTGDRPFQCMVCYDVFSHKKALSRHRELHMLPPTVAPMKKCRRCREEFHSEEQYNVHKSVCSAKVKYSDGGPKVPEKKTKPLPGERPFICNVCGMGLSRLTSLNEHMNTHTGEKPFVCTLCGERFLNSKALLRHRDKHDSKNPKCCRKCKHEFVNWEEFRTHVNQMACQVKLSTCHVCQETFTRVIDFETHYKFCHASEQKLYSCGQCGKKLSHKSHLNAHIRTHDSQAAVCATCGRQFVGETQLKRHIATAHTEPKCPYKVNSIFLFS